MSPHVREARRTQGHPRSPQWPRVEKAHLAAEGWCRYCGGTTRLQVHHIMPFHLDPARELDPANLITLCENAHGGVECHLHIGHLGNWKTYNPQIRHLADSPRPGLAASHVQLAHAK